MPRNRVFIFRTFLKIDGVATSADSSDFGTWAFRDGTTVESRAKMCERQQSSLPTADSVAGEDVDLSSQEEEEEEGVFCLRPAVLITHALPPPTDYYAGYYSHDEDLLGGGEEAAITDASFQDDPEHYWFSYLTVEEAWNFLDLQVKDTAQKTKVGHLSAPSILSTLPLGAGGPVSGERPAAAPPLGPG